MYQCPSCRRAIGLMADVSGTPTFYVCPYSRSVQEPQQRREPRRTRVISAEQRNAL